MRACGTGATRLDKCTPTPVFSSWRWWMSKASSTLRRVDNAQLVHHASGTD